MNENSSIQQVKSMKKLNFAVFASAMVIAAIGNEARAQDNAAGVHLGYNTSNKELFAGVHGRFDITGLFGPNVPLLSNPGIDFYFIDNVTLLHMDVNVLFPFIRVRQPGSVVPYVGPGLAIIHRSVGDFSSTDLGLNLLGGVMFNAGPVQPFVQGRYTLIEGDYFTISGGVSFRF